MKMKNTKRSLLLSGISLLLCASMFVGSTFAWFTDTVSSGRNTIQSGNLDVELYYALTKDDVDADNWTKVDANTKVFGYELWEPGFTKVAYFKVVNEGTLALKYQLTADVFTETAGVNKDGNSFLLSDYLYTKVVDADADRDDILDITDGYKFKSSIPMKDMGELFAEGKGTSEEIIALAIWMPESTGNEANHNGEDIPEIQFGINLLATQLVSEEDSFGPDYDKDSVYADAFVTDAAGLADALAEGGTVALMNDIALADAPIAIAEDTVIDLNGNTLKGTSSSSTSSNLIKVPAGTTLTLKNGTVTFEAGNPDTDWGDNNAARPFPGYANNTINCSGKLIIDGATIINTTAAGGASYAIDCYPGADLIINDGLVDGLDKIAIRMFANSNTVPTNVTINGGTVKGRRAVWVQLPSSDETKIQPVNLTVNGGTLVSTDSEYNQAIYSYSYGTNFDGVNIALNGGSYYGDVALGGGGKNGVKYGKENITVDTANCKFYGENGVYTYNTNDTEFVPVDNNASGAIAYDTASLKDAFKANKETVEVMAGTYTFPASDLSAGTTVVCDEDVVFEGVSSLNVNGATVIGATFDAAGNTDSNKGAASGSINGTFKDCTFTGNHALRYCYAKAGETVVFENCVFDGDVRGIHFDGGDGEVVFKNCTISGFNAIGSSISKATFESCTFTHGRTSYNGLNLYCNTELKDCTFEFTGTGSEFIDMEGIGKTLTITNCTATMNGVEIEIMNKVGGSKLAQNTVILDGVQQ